MKKPLLTHSTLKRSILSLAVITAIHSHIAIANPTGAQIINGQVSIDSSVPGVMNITNTPGAIINWQNFSIAQGEITRFIQQSSQSAVLNRVIGNNPSQIMGQLISNGQVYLINPNGVVFGANAFIDTQGLIVSSLNISDDDFQRGNYHFIAGSDAGNILNEGVLRVGQDGNIVLIAPNIENNGIIQTENGKIVLAAGQQLTLTSLDDPQIRYEVQSPENEVLNLGQMLTSGGAIDLFAGTLIHSGEVNTQSMTLDASGNISFQATNIELTGDVLAHSETAQGGTIDILGETINQYESSTIDASGTSGGHVDVIADNTLVVKGTLLADGGDGFIETSAPEVTIQPTKVSASGGEWLIDPTDITIDATTCTGTNCIDAATISSTLDNTDVSIATDASGTDAGDINVNASISKASGTGTTTLTLSAHNNININADITASSGVLNLNLAANIADNSGKIAFTNGSLVIDLFDGVLYTYGGSTVNVVNATTDISGNNIDLKNLTWNNAGTVNFNVSDATTFLNLTDSTLNNSGTFNDNSNASSYAFIKSNGTTNIINNTKT
jgi:filamentous hemagglutinin family protein